MAKKELNKKQFRMVNLLDPNVEISLSAENEQDAYEEAIERIGWQIIEINE